MPNGHDAVWPAIEELRHAQSATERDVAVLGTEATGLKEGQLALNAQMERFKYEIIQEVRAEGERQDERFDVMAKRVMWGIGIAAPVITALVAALLARGGT